MAKSRTAGIPNVPVKTPHYLRPFLEQLRNASITRFGLTRNVMDSSPTIRDLRDAGVIDVNGRRITGTDIEPRELLDVLYSDVNDAYFSSVISNGLESAETFALIRTEFDDHELLQNIRELAEIAKSEAHEVHTEARVLTEETTRISETNALAIRATALEATIDTPSTGLSARATALEVFQTYVEDQTAGGYLANASYFNGVEAQITQLEGDVQTPVTGVLARATALESFEATVQDQSGSGFLANASYIQGIEATVGIHSANWTAQATVDANQDGELHARYYNFVNVDGHITGYEYYSAGWQSTSDFIIRADTFQIRTSTSDNLIMAASGDTFTLDVDLINLNGFIPSANIGTASITEAKLGILSVTEAKIGTAAVTEAKIANLAVGNANIKLLAVDTAQIAEAAITNAKIDNLAVDTAQIASAAVTNAKIANLAVDTAQIAAAAITNAKIGDLAVDTLKIADNAVIVPGASSSSADIALTNSFVSMESVPVNCGTGDDAAGSVYVQAFCNLEAGGSGAETVSVRVRESGGSTGGDVSVSLASGASGVLTTAWRFTGLTGSVTFHIDAKKSGSATYTARGTGIFVQAVKK